MRRCVELFALFAVLASASAFQRVIDTDALWRYHDQGEDLTEAGWQHRSFDDSGWAEGPGELGYGDGDEATVISFGDNKNVKQPTSYFRHSFDLEVDPATLTAVVVGIVSDDGHAVFVNGVEVGRKNVGSADVLTYDSFAPNPAGSGDERSFEYYAVDPAVLFQGPNVVAVLVKQSDARSSDLSFRAEVTLSDEVVAPWLVGSPVFTAVDANEITASWKTSSAVDSKAWYSTLDGNPLPGDKALRQVEDAVTDHSVAMGGLVVDRDYTFVLGYTSDALGVDVLVFSRGSARTMPSDLTTIAADNSRFLVVGDIGADAAVAASVIHAYEINVANAGNTLATQMVSLGNAAYSTGSDADYIASMAPLRNVFANLLTWPVFGSLDAASSDDTAETGPFFTTFPVGVTETSGVESGKAAYYSFDQGAIHFVVLDSVGVDRSPSGAMATWLQADLNAAVAAGSAMWLVAAFHHPVYTAGSDHSDTTTSSAEMRANILPILEAAGVDVVLSGHTRAYERSVLLSGFTGASGTYSAAAHAVDASTTGPYVKAPGFNANSGAVFINVGSSGGAAEPAALAFPGMATSVKEAGAVVMDVTANGLDVKFVTNSGSVDDQFVLYKAATAPTDPSPAASPTSLPSATPTATPPPPSASNTPLPTPSSSPSLSETSSTSESATATPSLSETPSVSSTPAPSESSSVTASVSESASVSGTPAPSVTASVSESASVSVSAAPSVTPTISSTPTMSLSAGASPSASVSATPAASVTASVTDTPAASSTASVSESPSVSTSAAPTPSASPSLGASTTATASGTPAASTTATTSVSAAPSPSSSGNVGVDPVSATPSTSLSPSSTPPPAESPTPSTTPSASSAAGNDGQSCTCGCDSLACCGTITQELQALCASANNGGNNNGGSSGDDDDKFSAGTVVATAGGIIGAVLLSGVVLYIATRRAAAAPKTRKLKQADEAGKGPVEVVVGGASATSPAAMQSNPTYRPAPNRDNVGLLGAGTPSARGGLLSDSGSSSSEEEL